MKDAAAGLFPEELEIAFRWGDRRHTLLYQRVEWSSAQRRAGLRCGDNANQPAALYKLVNGNLVIGEVSLVTPKGYLASAPELVQPGKWPGKTVIRDADVALSVLRYAGGQPTCVIVKHNNPCGAARAASPDRAFTRAYLANRVGSIGACAAFNRPIDAALADSLPAAQLDAVVAPDFTPDALDKLASLPALCLLRIGALQRLTDWIGRPYLEYTSLLDGGLIAQWTESPRPLTRDLCRQAKAVLHGAQEIRCRRQPTAEEWEDLLFAWHLAAATASDSVVFVKAGATVSIGISGQDRKSIVQAARDKAYHKLADRLSWERFKAPFTALDDEPMRESIWTDALELRGGLIGAAMASDGAIGDPDALELALKEGVTAIIQPGGADADGELILCCNDHSAAMVFTGWRAFRH